MTSAQVDTENAPEGSEEGYERGLGSRQVQMIARAMRPPPFSFVAMEPVAGSG